MKQTEWYQILAYKLPPWMKKFPPNFEVTNEIPGVGGGINLEAYEEDEEFDVLPFYFYLNEYRADRVDESGKFLRMSDDEKSELIAKVDAWFEKHDIGSNQGYKLRKYNDYLTDGDLIWTDKAEADNYYWAYMNCPEIIMKIWKNYWGPHFIINYNQTFPQVIQ